MKLTKTLLLTTLALGGLLACLSARAQDSTNLSSSATSTNAAPRHMMPRGPGIEHLAQILNLTPDQKVKVKPIMDDQWQKMHQLFMDLRDGTVTRDQRMAKMKEIHDATAAQLKPILTDEQFQKWQSASQPHQRPMMMAPPAATNGAAASAP
jgi:Spy/CpxP family protein refolding chaperone